MQLKYEYQNENGEPVHGSACIRWMFTGDNDGIHFDDSYGDVDTSDGCDDDDIIDNK